MYIDICIVTILYYAYYNRNLNQKQPS